MLGNSAPPGFQHNADVVEKWGIEVRLTPGRTYLMSSTLTVSANGGASGAGLASFDETFTAEFGQTLILEPTTISLPARGVPALRRRRRPAMRRR